MATVFVTGTDTGVGKTVITGGIAAALRHQGLNVGIMKPVVAGLTAHEGHEISEDVRFLEKAAGIIEEHDLIAPYRLPMPAAPQLAAEQAGIRIEPQHILDAAHELEHRCDLLLVEGAGGWLVPITATYLMRDLAVDLAGPVLIVGRAGLGTINHTLLTVESVEHSGLRVLGIVLNGVHDKAPDDAWDEDDALIEGENPRLIRERTNAPILGSVPLIPGVSVERATTTGLTDTIGNHVNLEPFRRFVRGAALHD